MRAVFLVGLLAGLSSVVAQDRPCKTLLPPEVGQRVELLQNQLETALAAGELDAVKAKAAEVRKWHAGLPAGHWQRKSGDHLAGMFEKLAAAPEEQRKAFQTAMRDGEQAEADAKEGKYDEAEAALARVLAAHQKLFPAPSHALADTYRKIAGVLRDARKLEQAKGYAVEALQMTRAVWGDHPWTARAHLLLADLHDRLKEADDAETHYRRGWEMGRVCLGPSSDFAQSAKVMLQRHLAGRDRERQAEAVERLHTLDELELGLGLNDAGTIAASRSAAEALEALGDAESAEPLHRRVLAHQQANNADPSAVVNTLQMLTANLIRQNKLGEVEALARKAIEVQATLGDDHPGLPTAHLALGDALLVLQKTDAGLQAMNKALELRRKHLGEEHPGTINANNRIGNALDDLGRHADAEPYFRKSLELGVKVAGEANGNVAALRCNLGSCLLNQGKLDEAEKLLGEAAGQLARLEGTPGAGSATAMANLAGVQMARRKYEAALAIYARAHDAIKASAGEDHPLLARVYGYMGTALQQLGRHEQAEVILGQAVAIQRKFHGPDSLLCAMTMADLAECLLRREKPAEAEKLARQAVATLGKKAPGTPELAFAAVTLGRTLDAQGKLTEGETAYRQALTLLQAKGTPPRRLVKAQASLGANLHRQKRDTDAEPLLVQARATQKQDPLALVLDEQELTRALTETLAALGKPAP